MWRAVERLRRLPLTEWPAQVARGESPFIASAKLKLVDGCNLRCFMCDYWKRDREVELSTDEVVRVLEDLQALGCEKVHFTGGEIFLRRDALELFRKAHDLGMRVNLTTNGTVVDAERIRAMLAIPVRSITLSVDSPVAAIHDAVRGERGALRRTTRTIDRILRWRPRKVSVRVNTVVSARNVDSLLEMPAFLRDRPVDQWLLIPIDPKPQAGPVPIDLVRYYTRVVAPRLEREVRVPGFDPWIFGRTPEEMEQASRAEYALGRYRTGKCHVPWFHTLVDARGDVYPCCMGHRNLPPLGNVRERGLREVIAGSAYVRFRKAMLEARPEVCHHCDDFLAENRAIDALLEGRR